MKVYIIGAGPGDPELLTIKAKKIIENADVIIYAGSLINPKILRHAKPEAKLYNSAKMDLEEIIEIISKAARNKKIVARLHSGDPSIYGAIQEQMELLGENGIAYEVVPGISSFLAAAASLGREYTIPGISQTVIITRLEGRTKVPEKERLSTLAKHRASMCIFLSVQMIDKVVKELKEGYTDDTPVAVIYKASWKDERVILGRLKDITGKVKDEKIDKTALILVGDFLRFIGKKSKLYDKEFSHSFRGEGNEHKRQDAGKDT
jgi:precorrin-4/cobalt-precorrin-4 C11-methyltransferase